jgi:hypothetical protein
MSESKSGSTQNRQSAHPHESEQEAAARRAGKPHKSSRDAKSNMKAGSNTGAGGGAKQKQKR